MDKEQIISLITLLIGAVIFVGFFFKIAYTDINLHKEKK